MVCFHMFRCVLIAYYTCIAVANIYTFSDDQIPMCSFSYFNNLPHILYAMVKKHKIHSTFSSGQETVILDSVQRFESLQVFVCFAFFVLWCVLLHTFLGSVVFHPHVLSMCPKVHWCVFSLFHSYSTMNFFALPFMSTNFVICLHYITLVCLALPTWFWALGTCLGYLTHQCLAMENLLLFHHLFKIRLSNVYISWCYMFDV